MINDPSLFTLAVLATLFAGISKGGFGSGASFASASILALVLTPGQALGIMLPLLMLIDLATLKPYWRKWHWSTARLLIIGSIPGIIIGAFVYKVTNDDVIRFLIGALSLLFVLWQGARSYGYLPAAKSQLPDRVGLIAGCVAGFTSFVSHAGGPAFSDVYVVLENEQNRIPVKHSARFLDRKYAQGRGLWVLGDFYG